MAVSGVSSAVNPYLSTLQTDLNQRKANFQALGSALQSGDLTAAQKAFAEFIQSLQKGSQGQAPGGQSSDPFSADLQTLGNALQSGDLASAQKAFAALQQDLQKVHGRHHHHHHKPSTTSSTDTMSSSSTGTVNGTDGGINVQV